MEIERTRWGMTADEIVHLSGGAAHRVEGAEQEDLSGDGFTTLAVGEHRIDGFQFDVSFRAAAGESTLRTVRLELHDADQYGELLVALESRYGMPEPLPIDSKGAIEGFRWETGNETVTLQRLTWPMDLGVDVVVDFEKKPIHENDRWAS